jgi:large subunit ribosomal protein L32
MTEARRLRRAHDALRPVNPGICSNCGGAMMPHRICHYCGFYRGRQLVTVTG